MNGYVAAVKALKALVRYVDDGLLTLRWDDDYAAEMGIAPEDGHMDAARAALAQVERERNDPLPEGHQWQRDEIAEVFAGVFAAYFCTRCGAYWRFDAKAGTVSTDARWIRGMCKP